MALWTPANITVDLWLDASDSSSIALDGGLITQWSDKSGNNFHATQSVSGNRPSISSAALNGLDVVNTATSKFFSHISAISLLRNKSAALVFAVYKAPYSTSGRFAFSNRGTSSVGLRFFSSYSGTFSDVGNFYSVTSRRLDADASSAYIASAINTDTLQHVHSFECFWENGNASYFLDGTLLDTANYPSSGNTSDTNLQTDVESWCAIGSARAETAAFSLNGEIAEIIVIAKGSGVYSLEDRQLIEGYLAHKWGLQANLPGAHPYKEAAPASDPTISGTIYDTSGNPCQRKVYLMTRPTNSTAPAVIAHALSDSVTGYYEFTLANTDEVSRVVVSENDADPLLNDIIDRVIPG